MIVAKFGGAVLNGVEGIMRARDEIRALPRPLLVVVSAFANVTNLLEQLARTALSDPSGARHRLDEIVETHREIARSILSPAAFDRWSESVGPFVDRLDEIVRGLGIVSELSARTLDLVVHFGERFSSATMLAALNDGTENPPALGVSALDVVITDDVHRFARPDFPLTRERVASRLRPVLESGVPVVTEGYIARGMSGQAMTMGRESSSYSATMLGEMLGASEVRIYTDVPGILTADPSLVPSARTLPHLNYATAHTLAELGAKVLHPRTVRPVERAGIPLVITQFGGTGTVIDARGGDDCYSVVMLPEATLISLQTVVANLDVEPLVRRLSSESPVLWRHQFRRRVQIVTARPVEPGDHFGPLEEALRAIELRDVSVVSLVRHHGISGDDLALFFAELRDRPPLAMQGSLDSRAISVAIAPEDAVGVVHRLHERFAG